MTVTTSANVFNYELQDTRTSAKVLDVFNDTSNIEMRYQTSNWFDNEFLMGTPPTGVPIYYNFNGVSVRREYSSRYLPNP